MKRPLCMLCLAFVVSISIIMQLWRPPSFFLLQNDGAPVTIIGEVITKQTNQENLIIYLSNVTFQIKSNKQKVKGVICYLEDSEKALLDSIYIGSTIKVKGTAKEFQKPSNPGEFDQKKYQELEGYDFSCVEGKIIEKSVAYNRRKEFLYQIKRKLSASLDNSFSKKNVGIVKAMLLGEKKELEPDIKSLYQKNGIAHVLAISGLHISILGMGLYYLFGKLRIPIPINILVCIFCISQYGTMTGMSASCKRAVIMFLIQLFAQLNKRSYDLLTAMACSAVLILLWQPKYIYHSGFLLSFSAIMGIALLLPILTQHFSSFKSIIAGLSINLVTLPIQLFFFYEFSPASILLNLLVIPGMTILLGMGILVSLVGIFLPQIATLIAFIPEVILFLYEKSCLVFDKGIPLSSIVGSPSIMRVIIYYGILLFLILFYKRQNRKVVMATLVIAVLILCFKIPLATKITFLDVGQGDSACIQSREGEVFLIDGGSTSKKEVGKYRIIPFLKYNGISKIDYIFLSHMDADHISGILELIGEIKIKHIVVPVTAKQNEVFLEIKKKAEEENIKIFYMSAQDKIIEGDVRIECLAPAKDFKSENENENSLVLWVNIKKLDLLFTGDIEGIGEKDLVENMEEKGYKIVKVSHHGSKNANSKELLEKVNPKIAMISAGQNNRYGHPHKEVLERLKSKNSIIYQTKESGAITVWTNGEKIKIDTFKENTLDFP